MFWFALFSISAFAQPLATVSINSFTQGKSWTWEYRRDSGELYSTERYTVVNVSDGSVTLEMSTTFPISGHFESHHRILVNVSRCLKAYANPVAVEPWSMRMFHLNGATWEEVQTISTLAFEEKFNCNPHRHDSREFKTVFKTSEAGKLFQHKRWRKLPGTWFMNDGANPGVAFEKKFTHSGGGENFIFRLVQELPYIAM